MPGSARPSHAAEVMEMGYDGVLLNTAVAKAGDPVKMAAAFAKAVEAGRLAFEAGLIEPRDMASALDAGRGHALLQDRSRLLIDPRSASGLDPPRSFLSDPPRHGVARPSSAARHQAGAASHQGSRRKRHPRRNRESDRALCRASLPTRGQRLLARGDRRGRGLRPSRPGGSGGSRPLRHQSRGCQDRRQHA